MDILRKVPKVILLVLVTIILISLLSFTLVYSLGYIIGTLSVLLILFFFSLSLSKFFIFPGSFRVWRYWWQSTLEIELANNFIDHLHELKYVIELLGKGSNMIHIKKNFKQLQESLDIFKVLINSYNSINSQELNKDQRIFKDILGKVMKLLSEVKVIFPNNSGDLLSILGHTQEFDWNNATFEDFPENLALKKADEVFEGLEKFVVQFTVAKFPRTYLKEGLFTNLNILRLILQNSVRCEQYWVRSDGIEIDCFIVKNEENIVDPPVAIYCNPNGGLYEYACYQNNWLEYYVSLGIDFCMWNYRGYGRTKGTPSADSLITDTQAIYEFLTKVKMYSKILIHGESIGAVPACALASKFDLNLLFADRAFSSLSNLINSRLCIPKSLFKCLTRWTDATSQNFLSTGCYKVFSCDAQDELIPEHSSLKAGISSLQNCNQMDKESLNEFLEVIKNIVKYTKSISSGDKLTVDMSKSSYVVVSNESKGADEETISSMAHSIYKCLEIDAGGVSLYSVVSVNQLSLWISVLQLWGSFIPIGSNPIGKDKALQRIKASIQSLDQIFREQDYIVNPNIVSLCRHIRFLKSGFIKIQKCLENFSRSSTEEFTIRDEENNESNQPGFLIPLNCGHNGKFSESEKSILLFHLKQAKIIN